MVSAIAREVDPPSIGRGARENVQVAGEMAGGIDDVQAPVAEEIERVGERS